MTDKVLLEPAGSPVHWEHRERFNPAQGEYAPDAARALREQARAGIEAGYAEPVSNTKRAAALASAWRFDAELEHLDRVRITEPAVFATLPPTQKIGLGLYLDGKTAAAAAGIDTTQNGAEA